jgi:anthranilate phosphoribosyltransferase
MVVGKLHIQEAIDKLVRMEALSRVEIFHVLEEIKNNLATDTQIGGFLVGLVVKGVNVEELTAIAEWMRLNATIVKPRVNDLIIDVCGTGGGLLTFNVSTANSIVTAAAGIPVAKHGSRSISHKSGSADVLEELGININLTRSQAEKLIEDVKYAFLYAPLFHPVMGKVLKPESELGIKTVFYTVIGPLISPAHVKAHVLGVYRRELVKPIAEVLARLGYVKALVVHGLDGLDEISNIGTTLIADVENGRVKDIYEVTPEDFGVRRAKAEDLKPEEDSPKCNAEIIRRILKGVEKGARRDFLLANTAGSLLVGGLVKSFKDGVELAEKIIDDNLAYRKLTEIAEFSWRV